MTKLIRQQAKLPFREAKIRTDALTNGEIFVVETEETSQAEKLLKKAKAIVAVCEIIKDN